MPRSVEDIKNELKIVDERINSKALLLTESPDDFGLQLGIIEFEDRKEELIQELSKVQGDPWIYIKYLENRLGKTQDDLAQKQEIELLDPDNEELKEEIDCLGLIVEGLVEELKYCYSNQNIPVYEIKLTSKELNGINIPLAQLGEICSNIQEVPSAISKVVYSQKKDFLISKNVPDSLQQNFKKDIIEDKISKEKPRKLSKAKEMLSIEMVNNSQLFAKAIIPGSIRIILTTSQSMFSNDILNDSFTIFKNLIECGYDKSALQKQSEKFGDIEPISKYKNFLHTLYKYEMNIEFSGKTKKLDDFEIFKINHEDAKKIYKVLNKSEDPLKQESIKIGVFRAVDLVSKRFKFYVDEDETIIYGSFGKDKIALMEDKNFNETYKVKFSVSIPTGKFKKHQGPIYRVKEFLDNN